MTWALVPDADARHLAKANVANSENRVPEVLRRATVQREEFY